MRPSNAMEALQSGSTSIRNSSSGESTTALSNKECGATGVNRRARCIGSTIGPLADKEYAVEPVGVATIKPSVAYDVKKSPLMSKPSHTVLPVSIFSITASLSARRGFGSPSIKISSRILSSIVCWPAKNSCIRTWAKFGSISVR